jgi:hypothetical protein
VRNVIATALLAAVVVLPIATDADAARVVTRTRVTRHGVTRTHVTVRPGFPIHRTLPTVVVRPAGVVRVAPRVYLAPVVFTAAVVTAVAASPQNWRGTETLEREDGWTDFTMDVDRRGGRMMLEIGPGAAQISFAEVVFENGETQVVDFNDHVHARGTYSLLDFANGRKVDHVRVVAKADTASTDITLHLVG